MKIKRILLFILIFMFIISLLLWSIPIWGAEKNIEEKNILKTYQLENFYLSDMNSTTNILKPRILPDSKIFFLKIFGEQLKKIFLFTKIRKLNYDIKLANYRIIETRELSFKKEINETLKLNSLKRFQKKITQINNRTLNLISKKSSQIANSNISDKLLSSFISWQKILSEISYISEYHSEISSFSREIWDSNNSQIPPLIIKIKGIDQFVLLLEKYFFNNGSDNENNIISENNKDNIIENNNDNIIKNNKDNIFENSKNGNNIIPENNKDNISENKRNNSFDNKNIISKNNSENKRDNIIENNKDNILNKNNEENIFNNNENNNFKNIKKNELFKNFRNLEVFNGLNFDIFSNEKIWILKDKLIGKTIAEIFSSQQIYENDFEDIIKSIPFLNNLTKKEIFLELQIRSSFEERFSSIINSLKIDFSNELAEICYNDMLIKMESNLKKLENNILNIPSNSNKRNDLVILAEQIKGYISSSKNENVLNNIQSSCLLLKQSYILYNISEIFSFYSDNQEKILEIRKNTAKEFEKEKEILENYKEYIRNINIFNQLESNLEAIEEFANRKDIFRLLKQNILFWIWQRNLEISKNIIDLDKEEKYLLSQETNEKFNIWCWNERGIISESLSLFPLCILPNNERISLIKWGVLENRF